MGPEKWKGELPPDEAAEHEADAARKGDGQVGDAPRRSIDEREDDGYTQPESSAQKTPPPGPDEGEPSRE